MCEKPPAPSINRFLIKFYETGMGWICHAYRPGVHKPPQSHAPRAGAALPCRTAAFVERGRQEAPRVAIRSTRRKLESPFVRGSVMRKAILTALLVFGVTGPAVGDSLSDRFKDDFEDTPPTS